MARESEEESVYQNLRNWGRTLAKGSILIEGIIKDVDEANFTCDIIIQTSNPDGATTDTTLNDVPIKVLKGSQASFIEIPKVGSNCTIRFRDNNIQRPQLFQVDQSEKILIKIDNSTLQVDSSGWVFNGGGLNGMVKIDDLISNINVRETRINAIVTSLTSLATACNAVTTPITGTALGTLITTAIATMVTSPITTTVLNDLQNEKIKQ
jgi:hypothetical protein